MTQTTRESGHLIIKIPVKFTLTSSTFAQDAARTHAEWCAPCPGPSALRRAPLHAHPTRRVARSLAPAHRHERCCASARAARTLAQLCTCVCTQRRLHTSLGRMRNMTVEMGCMEAHLAVRACRLACEHVCATDRVPHVVSSADDHGEHTQNV